MNTLNKTQIYENLELLPEDLFGWNSESPLFHDLIEKTKHIDKPLAEIGTWKGKSAIFMANYLRNNKINKELYCIDTFLGACEFWLELNHTPERDLKLKNGFPQVYFSFLSNIVHNGLQEYIQPFPTTSTIAAEYFRKKSMKFSLLYLDASHSYLDVKSDLDNWFPLLENEGYIFGDDFNHFPEVAKAVKEFTSNNNLDFELIENNYWVIRK